MKLDPKEFKEYKKLLQLAKSKKLDEAGKARLAELDSKKNEKGSNDLAWWNNYPEVLASVANIPFNHIAGEAYALFNPVTRNVEDIFVPGFAVVNYLPTVGDSGSQSSAFNAQCRQLWLDMHRKYRGIGTYQASDIGIVLYCISNLFSVFSKFERIYSVVNTYKIQNRNVPFTLVNALGISQDILDNYADFRAGLNYRISKLQQLCLPKNIAAIQNEMILNMFIFKDSENPRSSLFAYDPEYYYVFEPNLLSTGGAAFAHKFADAYNGSTPGGFAGFEVNDVFGIIDQMMNALLADDDVARMCSDLIAAYGPENVMVMPYIPENLMCEPVHDYERKLQFHNLTIIPNPHTAIDTTGLTTADVSNIQSWTGDGLAIYQKDDVIVNKLYAYYGNTATWITVGVYSVLAGIDAASTPEMVSLARSSLFDTFVDKPGEMEIVCGSRFTTLTSGERSATSGGTTYFYTSLDAYGLEVATSISLWTKEGPQCSKYDIMGQLVTDNSTVATILNVLNLNQFDWCPILYGCEIGSPLCVHSDIDNATVLTVELLKPIHDIAIYSAFKIPSVSYIS